MADSKAADRFIPKIYFRGPALPRALFLQSPDFVFAILIQLSKFLFIFFVLAFFAA
jgi:hypothetical protein